MEWPRYPPVVGDELTTLLGSLERQRATFAWKCTGVDAEGMRARVGVSAITLGGLLKHMAFAEDFTFSYKLHGRDVPAPWRDHDEEWPWTSAVGDSPEELTAGWLAAVERSRESLAQALAKDGLDHLGVTFPDGQRPGLRRILVDFIEEYARHTGHADLIRETVDGLVGEDPPGLED
jgi:GNAT superfamily N-acetyltransferase